MCAVECCVVVLLCCCVVVCCCVCCVCYVQSPVHVCDPLGWAMRSMNLRVRCVLSVIDRGVRYLGNTLGVRGNNTAHPVYFV